MHCNIYSKLSSRKGIASANYASPTNVIEIDTRTCWQEGAEKSFVKA